METKDIILHKTFGLLLMNGYNGVSVSDIQQITGLARGLLYHYFQNQEQLFESAIVKYCRDWLVWDKKEYKECSISGLIPFVTGKYNHIAGKLLQYGGPEIALADIFLLFAEAMRHHPQVRALYAEVNGGKFAMWKLACLNSFSRGELSPGINLESVARQFFYLEEGILLHRFSGLDRNEVVYNLEKGLNAFLELIRR